MSFVELREDPPSARCAQAHTVLKALGLEGSPSSKRAGPRAGLGAGPGARLNADGRFACHSQLAAVPLPPSSLNYESHAAQHRVRGRAWDGVWGQSAGHPRFPEGAARSGEAAARSATPVRGKDRVAGTCACTGTQSCVLLGLKSCTLQGAAVSDTPQGKVARVGVPDAPV